MDRWNLQSASISYLSNVRKRYCLTLNFHGFGNSCLLLQMTCFHFPHKKIMKACIIALLIAAAFALNEAAPGKKTLVIMEKAEYKVTHSQFLANLERKDCMY